MKSVYFDNLGVGLDQLSIPSNQNILEQYYNSIKSRISAEESYAKDLNQIQQNLDKISTKSEIQKSFLFAALKSDALRRSAQIKNFAQSLKIQILVPTKTLITSQTTQSKKLQKQAKSYQKQFKQLQQRLSFLEQKQHSLDKQLQEQTVKNQIMKVKCGYGYEQKQKQNMKISELKQQQQLTATLYKTTTQQNISFLEKSRQDVINIFLKFQENVVVRIQKMIDNIKKLMIFQTAMMRNFDYDIVNIHTQVQSVNPKKDIQVFVENNKKIPKQQVKETKHLISSIIDQIESGEFQRKIMFENNQKIKEFINTTIKGKQVTQLQGYNEIGLNQFKSILKILDSCWSSQVELQKPILQDFKFQMEDQENRHLFALGYRSYNAFFSKQSNKTLGFLIQSVIQKAFQKLDIFVIRKILYVIFSKWVVKQPNSKPKEIILYRALQGNPMWKNMDFWDGAIFQSIQEKLKGLSIQKGQTRQQTKMKEQNIILSQLASYCHIMIMMGNSQKSVKLCVGKYCRLHGLGQQQNKVLSKSISQTLVTYKEYN